MSIAIAQRFCGRDFSEKEIGLIQEVVQNCRGLSRTELAHTVSELLDWKRPGGRLKVRECIEFLDKLAGQGLLELPASRGAGWKGPKRRIADVPEVPSSDLTGSVDRIAPLDVELVDSREQRTSRPAPLSRLCHAFWGTFAVSGICNPAAQGNSVSGDLK